MISNYLMWPLIMIFSSCLSQKNNCCQTKKYEKIPVETLFKNPIKTAPELSPDGTKIAFLAPINNVLNIWIQNSNEEKACPLTTQEERDIHNFYFALDNKHILFMQDNCGNENYHIFSINTETGEQKDLTPFDDVKAQPLKMHRDFPTSLLVALNKEDARFFDVYLLEIVTGELKIVAKNTGTINDWIIDNDFKVRAASQVNNDGSKTILYRDTQEDAWKEVEHWNWKDADSSECVGFAKDKQSLYLLDNKDQDTLSLIKLNTINNEKTLIFKDDIYDVSGVMKEEDGALFLIKIKKEKPYQKPCTKFYAKLLKKAQKLSSGIPFIQSHSNEKDPKKRTWIIGFEYDTQSKDYYLLDAQNKAHFLFCARPELNEYDLAPMCPLSLHSRDGLTLNGYLTLPIDKEAKSLPLVVFVHGGPWSRDTWGLSGAAQLFANRGYACLQLNFRGSTGYGKKFLNAGNKEWGGKMHDDLIDGATYLVKKGIVDSKKIAIVGGSYGGYAALVGATFTPDFFCCAVDIVGPSSLVTLLKSIPPYWTLGMKSFSLRVGDLATEQELLESRSPLFKVDQIKIPLLIIQGAHDPRVKQAESDQIVKAMKEKNIPVEYLLFENEGHGCVRQDNNITMFKTIDAFLEKYLC